MLDQKKFLIGKSKRQGASFMEHCTGRKLLIIYFSQQEKFAFH